MPRVKTTDYYGRYESADDLAGGDRIVVFWPDGSKTREILHEQKGHDTEQIDMSGGPDHFPTRQLFVYVTVRGKRLEVRLRGMLIEKDQTRRKV